MAACPIEPTHRAPVTASVVATRPARLGGGGEVTLVEPLNLRHGNAELWSRVDQLAMPVRRPDDDPETASVRRAPSEDLDESISQFVRQIDDTSRMIATPPGRATGLFRYMLKKYPRLKQCTRIGFMIEFTLYGPR